MSYHASFVMRKDLDALKKFLDSLENTRAGRTSEWLDCVFNRWMDEQGRRTFFAKVTHNDAVVGVGALRFDSEDADVQREATLEGFRIHPDHRRGGGVLRRLLRQTLAPSLDPSDPDDSFTLRALFATDNSGTLHSARKRFGFDAEAVLQEMEVDPPEEFAQRSMPAVMVSPKSGEGAWADFEFFTLRREQRRLALWEPAGTREEPGSGFLFRDFGVCRMNRERFLQAVARGQVYRCAGFSYPRGVQTRVGGLLVVGQREMGVRAEATTQIEAFAVEHEGGDATLRGESYKLLYRTAYTIAAQRGHRLMWAPYMGDELVPVLYGQGFYPDRWHQTVVVRTTMNHDKLRRLNKRHDRVRV